MSIFNQDGALPTPPFKKEITTRHALRLSTGANIGIIGLNGIISPEFGEYSLNLCVDGNLQGSPRYIS
jgi:hypothetical protein